THASQPSGRPAPDADAPFTAGLEARAGIPPGGNFHLHRSRRPDHPLPATGGAGVGDDRPLPAALTTGAGDGEEPLLETHLTAAAAGRTGLRRGPGLSALPVARVAESCARHRNRLLGAERRLLERELEVVAQILAALARVSAAASAAEEVTENITKDVFEVGKIKAAGKAGPALLEGGVTVAVVLRAFLRVRQDLVGLGQFFEFLLGGFVAGVPVRMVAQGRLAIGLFEFVGARVTV